MSPAMEIKLEKHLSEQASKAIYALSNVVNDNVLLVQDKLKLFDSIMLPILMYGSEIWGFCSSKAIYALSNVVNDNVLLVQDKLKLFDSIMLPILMYGSEIWWFCSSDDIEKVHLRFLKQSLGGHKQTSNVAVYCELERFPLFILRKIRILKYWFKTLNAPDSLLYKAYFEQVTYLNIDAKAQCVRNLLNELGFSYLWDFQSISKLQLNTIIQTVYGRYCQVWYSELAQSNNLDTFKTVNTVFNFDQYISCISIEKHRVALSRFRCSAHKLMIEEGRYRNIEKNNRLCLYWQMNVT